MIVSNLKGMQKGRDCDPVTVTVFPLPTQQESFTRNFLHCTEEARFTVHKVFDAQRYTVL